MLRAGAGSASWTRRRAMRNASVNAGAAGESTVGTPGRLSANARE